MNERRAKAELIVSSNLKLLFNDDGFKNLTVMRKLRLNLNQSHLK